jgi:hypothetical protein
MLYDVTFSTGQRAFRDSHGVADGKIFLGCYRHHAAQYDAERFYLTFIYWQRNPAVAHDIYYPGDNENGQAVENIKAAEKIAREQRFQYSIRAERRSLITRTPDFETLTLKSFGYHGFPI